MAKSKQPPDEIPERPTERFAGDAAEGSAWGNAFDTAAPIAAEPAPDAGRIDLTDPDAKAAWLELLTEAKIAGDTEAEKKLVAMLPDASGDGTEPDSEPLT